MTQFKISAFEGFVDRTIALFLVSLGVILAGATAVVGA
jgi:hypothetical protein